MKIKHFKTPQELNEASEKSNTSDDVFSSIYEYGRCKLISKEHKLHMIKNGMLDVVVKYIHLFND